MALSRILYSNLKGLRHKYVTFLLSSSFSVMIFCLFASLMLHPDFITGHIATNTNIRDSVIRVLTICEFIIVAFSFFFMWYSYSAFLRSRKKEFGLFSLLGATQKQLNQIIREEHLIIGAASLGIGISLSILLFKLLLMAVGRIMMITVPIRFQLVPAAMALTCAVYTVIFFLINLFTKNIIRSSLVIQLVRAPEKPRPLPRYSILLVALSLLCLGEGYYLAWTATDQNLFHRMLPVVGIVSLGTYFLFTQTSVAVLRRLKKNLGFSYKGTNLLTIGDLVFKMKENAQVLAVVSILSAVFMTSVGTIYTGNALVMEEAEGRYERALAFAVRGENGIDRMADVARNALQSHGFKEYQEVALWGIRPRYYDITHKKEIPDPKKDSSFPALLVSESEFNRWVNSGTCKESYIKPVSDIRPGETVRLVPPGSRLFLPETRTAYFSVQSYTVTLKCNRQHIMPPFRSGQKDAYMMDWLFGVGEIFLLDDADMAKVVSKVPSGDKARMALFIYDFNDWKRSAPVVEDIRTQAGPGLLDLSAKINIYMDRRQNVSLTLFIVAFVPILFFIASGSILYFRLFTELKEDQAKYSAMRKLGLSWKEISTVITRQIRLIFLSPFAIGAMHCLFALKALGAVTPDRNLWPYAGMAIGLFFVMQMVYYLITRNAYLREIRFMQ